MERRIKSETWSTLTCGIHEYKVLIWIFNIDFGEVNIESFLTGILDDEAFIAHKIWVLKDSLMLLKMDTLRRVDGEVK